MDNGYPDFSGKHVCLYRRMRPSWSYMLQDARFEMQGGRLFVVGRVSEAYDESVWAVGFPIGVLWDSVDYYLVYDSVEQYRRELTRCEAARAAAKSAKKEKKRKSR